MDSEKIKKPPVTKQEAHFAKSKKQESTMNWRVAKEGTKINKLGIDIA